MICRTAALLCASLLLCACGQGDNPPAPKLFEDQRDALDKAKAIDPAIQKQDDEQRKSIEQQTK